MNYSFNQDNHIEEKELHDFTRLENNKKIRNNKEEVKKLSISKGDDLDFFNLYEAMVDVVDDFENEAVGSKDNIKNTNQDDYNLFEDYIGKMDKENSKVKIYEKVNKIIKKLKIQNSTIIISFVYIDRLLNQRKNYLNWKSFEW